MYFSNFPLRFYEIQGNRYLVPDIINRVMFTEDAKKATDMFMEHVISDGDTPHKIASLIYGSSEYDWILFLFNDINDFFEDWPMEDETLRAHVEEKYGIAHLRDVHHYENREGEVVNSTHPSYDKFPVSNYEYEQRLNDEKRKIRLLKPKYKERVVKEFKELMNV